MSDPVVTPTAPASAPAPAPTTTAPAVGEEFKAMTAEQFTARLAREREAAIKGLGFKSMEEAKAAIDAAKAKADAEKTELQKATERAAALEGRAKQAETYEASLKRYLAAEESTLGEAHKKLLDLAPPAEQVEARLDWIAKARAQGLFGAQPAAPKAPNPSTTAAPAGPTPPKPAGEQNAFQRWESLKGSSPMVAAQYYAQNRTAIEAARPKT